MTKAMLLALLGLVVVCANAWADYPEKPLRIIVPFPAGGAGDAAARILTEGLGARLGQPVIVDNRPGANGIIGTQTAMNAAPDGYTLFLGHSDTQVLNPQTHKKLPYDLSKPMEPVAFISRFPGVLVSRPGLGASSGQELIKVAQAKPGKLTMGSWGIGSSVHVGMLMMEQIAGIEFQHVPFQGAAVAIGQLMAGQIDLALATPAFAQGAASTGKLVIIGASSIKRLPQAPDIKTLAEQGFPGLDVDTWYGVLTPPGTPAEIRQRLNQEINALLRQPDVVQRLRQAGHEVTPMNIPEFASFVASEYSRWGQLIHDRKITIDAL